ncbi:eukaryotic translation initiation factor 3 subunit A-like [Miscanthus floridulus]|uniref:eukaryotic translation initiation factor 3 subunit A-like n=1 Tax=Miscanthus floridulus TaxID=154761 RepID=UPI003459E0AC
MVPGAPLERTVLVSEGLDREEIKKRVKAALGTVPSDDDLDLCPPMRPDENFIEMDAARTARNQATAEEAKRRKDDRKKKRDARATREEREKRRKRQRAAGEEEESSSLDDDDDDEERVEQGVLPYDWLDSLGEEEEPPEGPSLPVEGRAPQTQLLIREPEDPDLWGAAAASGGGVQAPGGGQATTSTAQRGRDGGGREEAPPCGRWVGPQRAEAETPPSDVAEEGSARCPPCLRRGRC